MPKIGQFIYPWGGGHYSRMMRLDAELRRILGPGADMHYLSKGHVHEKLLKRFPGKVHEIQMPTPIEGKNGPSAALSMANLLAPVAGSRPLVSQIASYLREERRVYDTERFDLVINDGDMGSNILARNRGIPSMFVTNQFRPRLYRSRAYLYPSMIFVSRQIEKAAMIAVADSPPPHCICEDNLNLTREAAAKTEYVGHFAPPARKDYPRTALSELARDGDFGYWMRTGDRATNDATGRRYEEAFAEPGMEGRRRIVSHARADPSIDSVRGRDGRTYGIEEAADKKIDWIQIDVGFMDNDQMDAVLDRCSYAVVNGSHTVMGEIMGSWARPIIGMPVYDEHTNQIRWAERNGLGLLARGPAEAARAAARMDDERGAFGDALGRFARGFRGGGAARAAQLAADMLNK